MEENRQRASRQITICLCTLLVYISYTFTYSIILKLFAPNCTDVFLYHRGWNNMLWFVSRGVSDFFWLYPFLYLFWPKQILKKRLEKSDTSELSGSEEFVTVFTESDDEIETSYENSLRSLGLIKSIHTIRSNSYYIPEPMPRTKSAKYEMSKKLLASSPRQSGNRASARLSG